MNVRLAVLSSFTSFLVRAFATLFVAALRRAKPGRSPRIAYAVFLIDQRAAACASNIAIELRARSSFASAPKTSGALVREPQARLQEDQGPFRRSPEAL